MNNYKATPEQWEADRYDWSKAGSEAMTGDSAFRCILELRARVEALEAQGRNYPETPDSSTPPTVATDEELDDTWHKAGTAPGGTSVVCRRAIYNLGAAHEAARWREVAESAPVAGERAELVADLRRMASEASAAYQFNDVYTLTRAANTLQQLSEQEAGR
jgi:hypothetical protein